MRIATNCYYTVKPLLRDHCYDRPSVCLERPHILGRRSHIPVLLNLSAKTTCLERPLERPHLCGQWGWSFKTGSTIFILFSRRGEPTSPVMSQGSLGRQARTASENAEWGTSCSSSRTSFSVSLSPISPNFRTKWPCMPEHQPNKILKSIVCTP